MATINTDIAQKIDIVVRENNTATINLVITDETGTAFDLTGYNAKFYVLTSTSDAVYLIENNSSSTYGDLTNGDGGATLTTDGKLILSITTDGTSYIPGSYKHKLVIYKIDGTEHRTWMYGKFKINND